MTLEVRSVRPDEYDTVGRLTIAAYESLRGEIVGGCDHDLRNGEAGIRMLGVDPGAHGRGVGWALVHACVEQARAEGRRGLFLSSTPVMAAAHRLYERAGFVRTPERDWDPWPGFPCGRSRSPCLSSLDLRPGGGTGQTQGA